MANLTGKQRAFIDAYLGEANFNSIQAARLAGYKGNGKTLAQVGYENLRKPDIAKEVKTRLEAKAMSADELIMRWGDQARVNVGQYYDEDGIFKLEQFKADGHGQLIKSIKPGRDGPIIEFVDKMKSQELIARHLGMLIDKSEVIEIDGGDLPNFEDWKKRESDREDEAMETLKQFNEREDNE